MGIKTCTRNIQGVNAIIESMIHAARVPSAALAVVVEGETVFAHGYGCRDLESRLPTTSETIYPIASTTKAFNATLLGMLVDEGRMAWDAPVQTYLPRFFVQDPFVSAQITVRDLVVMRTGLPRHDWLWAERLTSRAEIVDRLRYLELGAPFRERFLYNNLTVTAAGHVAEVITGQSWEDLVQKKILDPLNMSATGFTLPASGNVCRSYHENDRRELVLTRRLTTEVAAPSGGSIHSHVLDMARWIAFNLNGGNAGRIQLIKPRTLSEIQAPRIATGAEQGPTPHAAYAMGWFVDSYNGRHRISHGGYLHDVISEVSLFPEDHIGIVSFTNLGGPVLPRLINQRAFDLLKGFESTQTLEEKLAQYEKSVEDNRRRLASVRRVTNTSPSHPLDHYTGSYSHPAYGDLLIRQDKEGLIITRHTLSIPLQHWHYDAWVAKENDFFALHLPHPFDRTSPILFDTDIDGTITALSIRLEPTVAPIRFYKWQGERQ